MNPSPSFQDERSRTAHVEITVVDVQGSAPRDAGARMYWYPGGRIEASIGGGNLELQALEAARKLWDDPARRTELVDFPLSAKLGQCCGGVVRLLLRKSLPLREVLICGAGHVATALAGVLADGPFRVTVADAREAWADRARFPPSVAVRLEEAEAAVRGQGELAAPGYLLIMTHDHPTDEALCRLALRYRFEWIGLIGSRTKWRRFAQRLEARGFSNEELGRITCPIGDPALGKTPQEIAISVAAQLLRVHQGMTSGAAGMEGDRRPGRRAALILAGGASRRMGRWKGALHLDGAPLIRAHAAAVQAAGAEVWKAVYPEMFREEAERLISPEHRLLNVHPEAPLFASLQLGLRALALEHLDIDSVLVVPVDMIPLDEDWIAALWDRHESTGAWATRPRVSAHAGSGGAARYGHPVILDQRLFGRLLAADSETERLDYFLRDLPDERKADLEIPAPSALSNLNTPEDYAAAAGDAIS